MNLALFDISFTVRAGQMTTCTLVTLNLMSS